MKGNVHRKVMWSSHAKNRYIVNGPVITDPEEPNLEQRRIISLTGQISMITALISLSVHVSDVMNKFVDRTREIVSNLESESVSLRHRMNVEKAENDAYLEKLSREYEEAQSVFREKCEVLETRLYKSTKVLDELVAKRFELRESKMKEIADLEKVVSITRLNTKRVNDDADMILQRIEREIKTRITDLLIT